MKIGLIDVDGHGQRATKAYPNLALAKIAAYHKGIGNDVEWYDPLFGGGYDVVYLAKVFNFSADYEYPINAKEIIKGGTGYDIHSCLPDEIDAVQPDFAIYKNVPTDTSYGFLTRGCPNRCPWCVVPRKEGAIRPYWDVDKVANGRKKIVLMDNNILAAGDYAVEQLDKIIKRGYKVDFNQALDARLVTDDYAKQLANIKWLNSYIRFGCDTHAQITECKRAMDLIFSHGYRGWFLLYAMIGGSNDFEESYARINYWREANMEYWRAKKGYVAMPFAQPFRSPTTWNNVPQWQNDLARWCNRKQLFIGMPFAQYEPRKGFKCSEYFTNKPNTTI